MSKKKSFRGLVVAESRLKALVDSENQEQPQGRSRLKALVPSSGFWSDFKQGATSPIRTIASAISGDPELRGLAPPAPTPDTLGGRTGEMMTESALLALPMGRILSTVKPAVTGLSKLRTFAQNAAHAIGQSFKRSPTKFVAAETALGGTSAAGGHFAQQYFPDSDAAQFIGEILGGTTPAAAPSAARAIGRSAMNIAEKLPLSGSIIKLGRDVGRMTDATTAGTRATERFSRGTQDPNTAVRNMDEAFIPGAREIMTPAQLSGESGLLSLEKSLIESSDKTVDKSANQLERLNSVIVGSLSGRNVSSEAAGRGLEETRTQYRTLLNSTLESAAKQSDDEIRKMFPLATAEEANRIVSANIDNALKQSNKAESDLYDLIDQSAISPTTSTTAAYRAARLEMGKTGAGDIPDFAKFFDPKSKSYLGRTTSIKEMRNAQSALREIARNARMGSGRSVNRNLARIADNLASAITDDLAMTSGGNPEAIRNAVAFSREQAEVFRQGTVGRILRTASDGGDNIPPALTLVESIGLGGPRGAQAFDDIVLAASGPETVGAMDSYLKHEFLNKAAFGGDFNESAATSFMRTNQGLLDRFPETKAQIEAVLSSRNSLDAARQLQKSSKLYDDRFVSKAALFIEEGPEKAFASVMGSRSPALEMDKLISMVGRDQTGEAMEGLRTGFYEYLLSESSSNGVVSGAKLSRVMGDEKSMAAVGRLFSGVDVERLQTIVRTAQRADMARGATPSKEGILGDELSGFVQTSLGIMGAAFGRATSSSLGGGTVQIPGIMAERFRGLGRMGLLNPAKRLVIDALQDEKLFRDVLLPSIKNPTAPLSEIGTRRLNAWALSAGSEYMEGEEN